MNEEKPRYTSKDLYNEITDEISLEKAGKYREILNGMNKSVLMALALTGLALALTGLAVAGIVYVSELINPPETPTDWDNQGLTLFACLYGLWAGISIGVISIYDGFKGHIRRVIERKIDDVLEGLNNDGPANN